MRPVCCYCAGRTGGMEHRRFADIGRYLPPGCVLVLNRSRVIPARLYGRRRDGGGKVELLLLRRESPGVWQALGKPGRRLRPGTALLLTAAEDAGRDGGDDAAAATVVAEVLAVDGEGVRTVRVGAGKPGLSSGGGDAIAAVYSAAAG